MSATAVLEQERDLRKEKLKRENHKLYWALYFHRNTRQQRMSFKKAKFLLPIYKALSRKREVMVAKSVQCGMSEAMVVSHLEEAARGLAVLYALPTTDLRNAFVQHRVNKLIKMVPLYDKILHETPVSKADSVKQKHFGRGVIRYVSSDGEVSFKEFPADAVYLDEKDQMNQEVIAMAPDRLQSSQYRFFRVVANPTIENYGIDVDWKESSQGAWNVCCSHCGEWQALDWYENVVRKTEFGYESRDKAWTEDPYSEHRVFCRECNGELERFSIGEYIHKYPRREKHGFRINKIFGAIHVPLREVVATFFKALNNETDLQLFYNSSLGIPYTAKGSKVTREDLDACLVKGYEPPGEFTGSGAVMGCDVGKVLHVVIRRVVMTKGRLSLPLLYVGRAQNENDLVRLASRFSVKNGIIDALPETRLVDRAQTGLPWLYKCFFSDTAKYPTLNRDHHALTIERTSALDRVKEAIDSKQYINPVRVQKEEDYYDHMQNGVRALDKDRGRFIWKKTGPDHYLLAEAYCIQAADMLAKRDVFGFYEAEEEKRQQATGKTKQEALDEIAKQHNMPGFPLGELGGL